MGQSSSVLLKEVAILLRGFTACNEYYKSEYNI